jgi:hypothetical protein
MEINDPIMEQWILQPGDLFFRDETDVTAPLRRNQLCRVTDGLYLVGTLVLACAGLHLDHTGERLAKKSTA